jgi:hypothetical protein
MDQFDEELRASVRTARIEEFVVRLKEIDVTYNKLMIKTEASWDDFDKLEMSYVIAQYKLIIAKMMLIKEADHAQR